MFGLGFGEILVILVVVLLVFGPEKLPEVARTLGRTMAELRRGVDDIRHELTVAQLDTPSTPPVSIPSAPNLEGTCEAPPTAPEPLKAEAPAAPDETEKAPEKASS